MLGDGTYLLMTCFLSKLAFYVREGTDLLMSGFLSKLAFYVTGGNRRPYVIFSLEVGVLC